MRNDILDKWARKVARRRNRPFLEASMAAAALVSMADEDVRLSELLALDEVLQRIDRLKLFEPNEAVDLHRRFTGEIQGDAVVGRRRAIEIVSSFAGNRDDRLSILYIAAVIARADLDLSALEEAALQQICECLGLSIEESLAKIWNVANAND